MIKAAIMGHGTVGSGVYEVMQMNAEKIAASLGEPMEVKYVLDLRDFAHLPYGDKFVTDFSVIENDPEITVVAEVMGGVGAAYEFTKRCL
ncbi:MAG: homoserine dehydrogenase, partial [Intestinibacillus sp.]